MEEWKQRLRHAREDKGLKKTDFAKRVGVSNATVTDWEKPGADGGIKEISGAKLTKVSEVLGIDPRWLLHGQQHSKHSDMQAIAPPPGVDQQPLDHADDVLRRAGELIDTYRLANAAERDRIDRLVRGVRRRLRALNETKPGPT